MVIMATNLKNWKTGQQVHGLYHGVYFIGRLHDNTRPTPDYKNTIFSIDLERPIFILGSLRRRIEIWSNDSDKNMIEATCKIEKEDI